MDSSEHIRFKVSILFFGAFIGIRAARILLDNMKWRRMIREKQYVTVEELGTNATNQNSLEAYEKLVVDIKEKHEAKVIVIGKLVSDQEWNPNTKRREDVFYIQDFISLNCVRLDQVKSVDLMKLTQPLRSTVTEKISNGVVVDVSERHLVTRVTPLAVLATLCFDNSGDGLLKLKDFKCIEDCLKSVEFVLEESDTTQFMLLTISACVVAYGLFALRTSISCAIKDIHRLFFKANRPIQEGEQFSEEQLCIACYASPRQVLTLPCKHFAMCRGCLQHYQSDKCIICKEVIRSIEFIDQQP